MNAPNETAHMITLQQYYNSEVSTFSVVIVLDSRMLRELSRHTESLHKIKIHTFDPEIIGGDFYIYSLYSQNHECASQLLVLHQTSTRR